MAANSRTAAGAHRRSRPAGARRLPCRDGATNAPVATLSELNGAHASLQPWRDRRASGRSSPRSVIRTGRAGAANPLLGDRPSATSHRARKGPCAVGVAVVIVDERSAASENRADGCPRQSRPDGARSGAGSRPGPLLGGAIRRREARGPHLRIRVSRLGVTCHRNVPAYSATVVKTSSM